VKKQKYNPVCIEDEESISGMLSEELYIDSHDEMNLENEGQRATEESSSNASSESECESETSVVHIDGWEDVTVGNKKPKAYTFTKNVEPRFNLPGVEPMDYFRLFFNDELLNNILIERNRYARHKILELQLSPRFTWSM
jgi:hypothetical protein